MKRTQCRTFCGKYFGWISFASNLFNACFKIILGLVTRSQALVADGFHSLADAITAIVTIATLRVSEKPSDKGHPYGHGKIEFLSAAFFSMVLMALALIIISKSIYTIIGGDLRAPSFLAIGPALVSILVNITISRYGLCVGREINSPVIVANAKENKADAYSSIASLVGIVGALSGYPILDPLAAIVVSFLIGHMGYEILTEAGGGLMDASISRRQRKRISRLARLVPGVQGISFLKTRRIGQKVWADVGIVVPSAITLAQGDTIAQEVRSTLLRNFIQMQDSVVYLEAKGSGFKKRRLFGNIPALFGKMRSVGSQQADPGMSDGNRQGSPLKLSYWKANRRLLRLWLRGKE